MLRLLLLCVLALLAGPVPSATADDPPPDLDERLKGLAPLDLDEVVWLARCIYSESDRPHEQRLVAWVVRNRVETQYRGTTYRSAILEPKQFSAFNTPTPRRARILTLDEHSTGKAWRTALGIALDVYQAPADNRPFTQTTRHFYSPVSMKDRKVPHWAKGETPLSSKAYGVDPDRFLFFDAIEEGPEAGAPALAHDLTAPTDSTSAAAARLAEQRARADALRARLKARRSRLSGTVSRPARPHVTAPRRQR